MKHNKCNCGGVIKKDKVIFEELIVEGFKCERCGTVSFSPEQTEEILRLRKLSGKANTQRRIITPGHSPGMTIPKKLDKIGAKVGAEAKIRPPGKNTMRINFE